MADINGKSRTPKQRTDDLLNDYLSDLFGGDATPLPKESQDNSVDPALSSQDKIKNLADESNGAAPVADILEVNSIDVNSLEDEIIEVTDGKPETSTFVSSDNCLVDEHDSDYIQVETFSELLPQERQGAIEKFTINRVKTQADGLLASRYQVPVNPTPVQKGFYLIPTVRYGSAHNGSSDKNYRSQDEALLLLYNSLYFLRRPLPVKVRESFLQYGEQAIDDYHAAKWLAQMPLDAQEAM